MSFFLIILSMIFLIYGYSSWRVITPAPWEPIWKLLTSLITIVLATLPLILTHLRNAASPSAKQDFLAWLTYLSMSLFTVNTFLFFCRDLGWLILAIIFQFIPPTSFVLPHWTQAHTANIVTFSFTIMVTLYGFYRARHHIRIRRITIPIKDLPVALKGFTIAQISDLHVGPTIKKSFIERVVQRVNNLQADLIAFTGDLADGPVEYLRPHTAPLANLQAPHGTFFVTGNHEYYSGVDAWITEARRLGFTPLLNQHHLLYVGNACLAIAGVTDYSDTHSNPSQALHNVPTEAVKILLAHQPRSITAAVQNDYVLQLSGHTHGGQFIPWKYLIPLQQPYITGLYRIKKTWLFVSNGTGYWGPPLRLDAPAEIVLVTLQEMT